MSTAYVVDWGRMKRLSVPEQPGLSWASKACLVVLALCIICLVKKYRDRRAASKPESLSELAWESPRVPGGL